MLFDALLCWPDQLPTSLIHPCTTLERAAVAIRLAAYPAAEAALLGQIGNDQSLAWLLLAHLRVLQQRPHDAQALVEALEPAWQGHPFGRYLQAQIWLLAAQHDRLAVAAASGLWSDEAQEPLLALAHVAWHLRCGHGSEAQALLSGSIIPDCPERVRLQARVLKAQGQPEAAIALLQAAADRASGLIGLQRHLVEDLLDAQELTRALPRLRQILQQHGEAEPILAQVATIKLLQRQQGLARRAALLHRLKAGSATDQAATTNQLICYEQTGHSDWLEYPLPALVGEQADPNLLANLVMQLASVESPKAAAAASRFCELMQQRNQQMGIQPIAPQVQPHRADRPLRVVWMSGDIADHPVGRFLYGFFYASRGALQHQHTLVSWSQSQGNPFHGYFSAIPHLRFLNAEGLSARDLVARVRDLQADVVIDCSGWTAKNFGNGFLARLAPCQINYLGYFASTGNPAMDRWLGDAQLFPEPMREWHSEALHRLPRCFIAWQPPPALPEAQVPVPPPPSGPIRFGSFNHNRKFSDRALRLWGQILRAIPDSSLVLKATAPGDEATLDLLCKRMRRCGLDPGRVVWLPLVASNREHLLQYGQIDVALDCLPNGGCTTTCEALWMGVPVITLSGNTYVSRMSTAVLHGAGLQAWCAPSEEHYLQLALQQADRLAALRQERNQWRAAVSNSPLGDAADLMRQLEVAFSHLVQTRSTELASSR